MCYIYTITNDNFIHGSEKLQCEVRKYHKQLSGSKSADSASVVNNQNSPKKRSFSLLSGTVGD